MVQQAVNTWGRVDVLVSNEVAKVLARKCSGERVG